MQFPISPSRSFLLLLMFQLIGLAPYAIAETASDFSFEAAQSHFSRARQGDADQVAAAITAFQATPANPALQAVYSAYLGSAQTLKGKAAWLPWDKMKYTEQGLDQIDQALASLRPEHERLLLQGTPASLLTRMVAAATFVALPDGIFHRRAAGKSLLAEMRRSPQLAATPAAFRAELSAVEARLDEAGK